MDQLLFTFFVDGGNTNIDCFYRKQEIPSRTAYPCGGEGSSSISRVGLQRYDRDNLAPRIIVTINLFEKKLGSW